MTNENSDVASPDKQGVARHRGVTEPRLISTTYAESFEPALEVGKPCPKCGSTVKATGPPINEYYCPTCPVVFTPAVKLVFNKGICLTCCTIPCQCSAKRADQPGTGSETPAHPEATAGGCDAASTKGNPMSLNIERERFENWWALDGRRRYALMPDGKYRSPEMQSAWCGWKARAGLTQTDEPGTGSGNDDYGAQVNAGADVSVSEMSWRPTSSFSGTKARVNSKWG